MRCKGSRQFLLVYIAMIHAVVQPNDKDDRTVKDLSFFRDRVF